MTTAWSQRDDESGKAYQAFLYYLEGRARTQFEAYLDYCEWNWDRARREHEQATKNEPPRSFKRWPMRYDWNARRRAYYADIDEVALSDLMDSKARRKVQRIELLDDLKDVVSELGITFLRDKVAAGELHVNEFVALFDKLFRNYRDELNDLPTEKSEATVDASITYELEFTSRAPEVEDSDGE